MIALFGAISIVAAIIGFIGAVIFAFKRNPIWKKWMLGGFGCFALLIFLVVIDSPSKKTEPETKPAQAVAQPAKPAFNWATADVTEATIREALAAKPPVTPSSRDAKFPSDITKIDIVDSTAAPGQKHITLHFKPDMSWDETTFVRNVGGTEIVAGSMLFSNPKVEEVTCYAQTEMQDQYGKSSVQSVIKITLKKATAGKIDWKGLADRHITDPGNIYRIADHRYIHPGILKEVPRDKVRL